MKEFGIKIIDCQYVTKQVAASFLIREKNKAVFIETNTNFANPILLKELEKEKIHTHDVEYIIITHSHLDHSGGTHLLLQQCPNAKLIAHPKAAKLMIEPSKLIMGVKRVYGEETFLKLYGNDILPIPSDRIYVPKDGEKIKFYNREFQFIYTQGHSTDHFCIYDSVSNSIFTGDSFGISYPDMRVSSQPFIYPGMAPIDFDPKESIISIDKIIDTGASKIYLTHFGVWDNPRLGKDLLFRGLEEAESILETIQELNWEKERIEKLTAQKASDYLNNQFEKHNIKMNEKLEKIIPMDASLNAQGIYVKMVRNKKKLAKELSENS